MSTRVLLVEDDRLNLRALTIYLKLSGLWVEQAYDGFEALRKLARKRYDVVVSDLRMPGLNGIDLAKRIHNRLQRIPIVLITGDPALPTMQAIHEAGVLDLLTKPFMPAELVKIIREQCPVIRAN